MNNLIKEIWTENDINELNLYIDNLPKHNDILREKNIINTNMDYLGAKSKEIKNIAKEIYKGNYISYLEMNNFKYYENTLIYAYILNKIKDFNVFKKYLDIYSKHLDNWSSVDTISPSIKDYKRLFKLALKYINSKKPFVRRLGLRILFLYTKKEEYLNGIFDVLDSLINEENYYVNMIAAWLLCELFIKNREATIEYCNRNKTNKFIISKAISKCIDSYRITEKDKGLLRGFKKIK